MVCIGGGEKLKKKVDIKIEEEIELKKRRKKDNIMIDNITKIEYNGANKIIISKEIEEEDIDKEVYKTEEDERKKDKKRRKDEEKRKAEERRKDEKSKEEENKEVERKKNKENKKKDNKEEEEDKDEDKEEDKDEDKDEDNEDEAIYGYRDIKVSKKSYLNKSIGIPYSNEAQIMLTDYYQIKMCYGYWKNKMHLHISTFEVYFRKCPFKGEFAIFAGLNELLRFINTFKFSHRQISFLKQQLPDLEEEFFEYLKSMDGSNLTIHGVLEGKMVFSYEPVVRIEGPLGVCQIIETPVLNLLNFSTLIATNAARFRLAAGWNKTLLEFGARRAQGGDGAMSASRYTYLGGFDGTSNVRAGFLFRIPLKGTQSHSFITAFLTFNELKSRSLGPCEDFVELVLNKQKELSKIWPEKDLLENMHKGELASFIAFAQAFPAGFLCLVDTYDVLLSGVPNFISVALALNDLNFKPIGIRLDSGDLAYLSKEVRQMFIETSKKMNVNFQNMQIVASNNINESVIHSLNEQHHEIDVYGIGTNLVTCESQPALGMVYKLVELMSVPCMKLSQEVSKISLPSKKNLFRFYSKNDIPIVDFIQQASTGKPPLQNKLILCRHMFDDVKRCNVIPSRIENMLIPLIVNGKATRHTDNIHQCRERCISELKLFRPDHLRHINPTPYKVSVAAEYFDFFRKIWQEKAPVKKIE